MKTILLVIGGVSFLLALWGAFMLPLANESAILVAGFAVCSGLTFIASAICAITVGGSNLQSHASQRMQAEPGFTKAGSEPLMS